MSIDQHIITLELLVEVDGAIKELTSQLEQARGEIEHVRSEVANLESRIAADGASVEEMEKTRGALVQELRQMDKQISRSRERLQRARNEREANAAERELDELRKLQRDRDDELQKLASLCDQARETIAANEVRRDELNAQLEGSLEGVTKTITDCESQLEERQGQREEVQGKLPSLTYRRYQSMHERGKLPVSKTHDGTCIGCYVQIPPMQFHNMLSRQRFEECPHCHRIIYYEPPSNPEESDEGSAEPSAPEASAEGSAESSAPEAST